MQLVHNPAIGCKRPPVVHQYDVGLTGKDAGFQIRLETGHDGDHNDQGHYPDRHPGSGQQGDERNKRLPLF